MPRPEVLFGDVNPSGKLPLTFPASRERLPLFDNKTRSIEHGHYHGYRLFDRQKLTPSFPFGFGLRYTSFRYSSLRTDAETINSTGQLEVSFNVTNTGAVAGVEVAQLYVSCTEPAVDRAVRELKGFAWVALDPGRRLVR